MKIENLTKGTTLVKNCKAANSFLTRFMGLMGKDSLPEESGLILTPCNSIHMFFMKFPLDIVFVDKNNMVVHVIESIRPWKFSKIVSNGHSTIELPVGSIEKSKTTVGDRLQLIIEN